LKRLLPGAVAIAVFILPPAAFASKFVFNSPGAGYDILSASICSRNIASGGTSDSLADLLNTATDGHRNNADNLADNSSDSTSTDYLAGLNGLGPDRGGLHNINLFNTNSDKAGNGGSTPTTFGFEPEFIYSNDGTSPANVAAPSVPEPMSMLLLGSGLAGLYVRRRRQKNSA